MRKNLKPVLLVLLLFFLFARVLVLLLHGSIMDCQPVDADSIVCKWHHHLLVVTASRRWSWTFLRSIYAVDVAYMLQVGTFPRGNVPTCTQDPGVVPPSLYDTRRKILCDRVANMHLCDPILIRDAWRSNVREEGGSWRMASALNRLRICQSSWRNC